MHQIIQYISANWIEWIFVAITSVIGLGYRQISKHQAEESTKNDAMREGVQALLRDRIIDSYNCYKDKGYCPIYAKENIKRMYEPYHELGGNDVATRLKDDMLEMPTEREE